MSRSEEIHTCLVCHNVDCEFRGSVAVGEEIARQLAEAESSVEVKPYLCFGACGLGPNIVVYPQGTMYMGCELGDAEQIVRHILGGEPVERLTKSVEPALRDLILEILDSGMANL